MQSIFLHPTHYVWGFSEVFELVRMGWQYLIVKRALANFALLVVNTSQNKFLRSNPLVSLIYSSWEAKLLNLSENASHSLITPKMLKAFRRIPRMSRTAGSCRRYETFASCHRSLTGGSWHSCDIRAWHYAANLHLGQSCFLLKNTCFWF